MALCPFAKHRLIKPGSNDPRINARVAILHVDAGNAFSLFKYFKYRSGGIESHFHIRKDGVIEQYRDTAWQADANYRANDFAISIETQGFGRGKWNAKQLASIKRLLKWLHEVEGIPLEKVEKWNGSGVGYHVQFGAPGPWTPVAKSCPGPRRINQYNKILVPWMDRGGSREDDDMSVRTKIRFWNPLSKRGPKWMHVGQQINQARGYSHGAFILANRALQRLDDMAAAQKQIQADLEEIKDQLK